MIIAVFDDGVELNHPDLVNNMIPTFIDIVGTMPPKELRGIHGTQVAGIIGAEKNNSVGVSGVIPNCQMLSIVGPTTFPSNWSSTIMCAFIDATNNNAAIINCSWGIPGSSPNNQLIEDGFDYAFSNGRNGLGSVIVFASLNHALNSISGTDVAYPATGKDHLIVVGAITPDGVRKTATSSIDLGSNFGPELDLMAPGDLIPTTDLTSNTTGFGGGQVPGSDYNPDFENTSAAAPHVSGVVGLMLSVNPCLSYIQVEDILNRTARKIRTDIYSYGPYTPSGNTVVAQRNYSWNQEMGHGLLDAEAAVKMAQDWSCSLCSDFDHVDYEVGQNPSTPDEIWSPTTLGKPIFLIQGQITIPAGKSLTITDGLAVLFANSEITGFFGGIVVEPGGKLILENGAVLTSTTCNGDMWDGIVIEGDATQQQITGIQGAVEINNGSIRNARNALMVYGFDSNGDIDWNKTGGIVDAYQADFQDNWRAVEYLSYENRTTAGFVLNNRGKFIDCDFTTASELKDGRSPNVFMTLYDVRGITVQGCRFENTIAILPQGTDRGSGILTMDASVTVGRYCNSPVFGQPCPTTEVVSEFNNLKHGIVNWQGGADAGDINVRGAEFNGCSYGIISDGAQFTEIHDNTFNIPVGDASFPFSPINAGVYSSYSNGANVEGNVFNSSGIDGAGQGRNIGTYMTHSTSITPNAVFLNEYNSLETQVQTASNNNGLLDVNVDCNTFNRGANTVADFFHGFGALTAQGLCSGTDPELPQANNFSGICNGVTNQWQLFLNPFATPFLYESYNNSLTGLESVQCVEANVVSTECGPSISTSQNYSQACDPVSGSGGPFIGNQLALSRTQYSNARDEFDAQSSQIDINQQENLIVAIADGTVPDWQLRDWLLNQSPLLLDEVLIALVESQRPAWVIQQVVGANFPVSDDVLEAALLRTSPLPDHLVRDMLANAAPVREDVMLLFLNQNAFPEWVVKDVAIANTPLPDNQLIALINRNPALADWALKDILRNNTPLSQPVWDALNNRIPPLPNWAINQIQNSSIVAGNPDDRVKELSEYELKEREVAFLKQDKLLHLNGLVRLYLDTNMVDSAMYYLEMDGSIEGSCALVTIGTKQDTVKQKQHIQSIRAEASRLDSVSTSPGDTVKVLELTKFCDYYDIVRKITSRPGGYYSISPDERLILETYANSDLVVSRNARAILSFLDVRFPEYPAEPYVFPKKAAISESGSMEMEENKSRLSIFPNPTDGAFVVSVDLESGARNPQIEIHTIDGRLIHMYRVPENGRKIEVNLDEMQPGIYLVSLRLDGIIIQTERVVKL